MTDNDKHRAFADGLRQMADFIESAEGLRLPVGPDLHICTTRRQEFIDQCRALGDYERVDTGNSLRAERVFGPLRLGVFIIKSDIAEQPVALWPKELSDPAQREAASL